MSLTIACPECRARIEVDEDLAGKSGKCPRCQHVFVIPDSSSPAKSPAPWAEPADDAEPAPRRRRDREPIRSRSRYAGNPIGPWLIAGVGVAFAVLIAVGTFTMVVALSWHQPFGQPRRQIERPPILQDERPPTIGRMDGRRLILDKGVFQLQTELTFNDDADPDDMECRCKRYEVELRHDRSYVIEMRSDRFDCLVRVETLGGEILSQDGNLGNRHARLQFFPQRTEIYAIYATCFDPALGPFTLNIRDQGEAKAP